jgi:hypothetical protein
MPVVSAGQVFPAVAIRGSRQAGLVSAHLRAIRTYLSTGDARAMHSFRGKSVTGTLPNGEHRVFELEADLDYIDALAASAAFDGLTVGS